MVALFPGVPVVGMHSNRATRAINLGAKHTSLAYPYIVVYRPPCSFSYARRYVFLYSSVRQHNIFIYSILMLVCIFRRRL